MCYILQADIYLSKVTQEGLFLVHPQCGTLHTADPDITDPDYELCF